MQNTTKKTTVPTKSISHTVMVWLCILFIVFSSTVFAASTKPNVVFFYADDLGWNDVGYNGSMIETPHIDTLASQGVRMGYYYTYPVCGPSRLGLMTGRNPITLKQADNLPRTHLGIDLSERFLPQMFQDAGYQTWGLGKWHLGGHDGDAYWPTNRGFDHYYGFMAASTEPYQHVDPQNRRDVDWWFDDQQITDEGGEFCMDLLTDQALDWIDNRDQNRPFFLYFAYHAVHSPLTEPPNGSGQHPKTADYYSSIFPDDSNRQMLASMVSGLDDSVGSVMQKLKEQGLDGDNTIVLFVSDNGGATELGSSNLPLSGGKGTILDGGIRVPALVRWPGHLDEGTTSTQFMSHLDWYPTLAEMCQIAEGDHLPFDGSSKWKSIENGTNDTLFEYAVNRSGYVMLDGEWKLYNPQASDLALYNILTDPSETTDLSASNPDIVSRLQESLSSLINATDKSTTETFSLFSEVFPGDGIQNYRALGGDGEFFFPGSNDLPSSPVVDSAQGWGAYPNSTVGDIAITQDGLKIAFRGLANVTGSYIYTLFDAIEKPEQISITYGATNIATQTARLLLKDAANGKWYASAPDSIRGTHDYLFSNLTEWYEVISGGSELYLTGQAKGLTLSETAQNWPGATKVSGFGFYVNSDGAPNVLSIRSIDLKGISVVDNLFELKQYDIPARENFNSYRGTGVRPGAPLGTLNSNVFSVLGIETATPELTYGESATSDNFAGGAQSDLPTTPGLFAFDKLNNDFSLCVTPGEDCMTSGGFVLKMINQTGHTIHTLDVGFEVIHNNSGHRSQQVSFGHAADYSSDISKYEMIPALDFNTEYSTTVATNIADWASAWMETSITSLTLAPGDPYYLLFFTDRNTGGSGSDDHVGWDNISVTPRAAVPPTIQQHPISQSVASGDTVTLEIEAVGAASLAYQWTLNGTNIIRANSNSYTIDAFAQTNAGSYRCIVTNAYGTDVSSTATLRLGINASELDYPIVDSNQIDHFNTTNVMDIPEKGQPFYGQDAMYIGHQPNYVISADGLTVTDNVTRLVWQQSPDHNDDGDIDINDKMTWPEAVNFPATLNAVEFGGYTDWRLPSIKELYSLILFSGKDPSGYTGTDTSNLTPYIDTDYFDFNYGDQDAGDRIIDAQYWSATSYVSTTMHGDPTAFGVNFADGRIKGYPKIVGNNEIPRYVLCVRGNTAYGKNNFIDNDDGTITDLATGLMWLKNDSGIGYDWEAALDWTENLTTASYSNWRLPDAKELQSLIDYSRSPDTSNSPAIDPLFICTSITNHAGAVDYPYYWTGTTHVTWNDNVKDANYLSFGRAMGKMVDNWLDVHGAGAQRSDPKNGDPLNYPDGRGPQGDAIRIYNYVRAVRSLESTPNSNNASTGSIWTLY